MSQNITKSNTLGSLVYVTSVGVISPAGCGMGPIQHAIETNQSYFVPLTLFATGLEPPKPVGQVADELLQPELGQGLPRTHALALRAAEMALDNQPKPQALIIGCTTGGMKTSEELLRTDQMDAKLYRYHATGSVAETIARRFSINGPAICLSTACSSAAVAMKVAINLLRSGRFSRVLVGGADGLCRLTYFGFDLLKLLDRDYAKPLDQNRAGMTLAEGAAMFVLESAQKAPDGALAVLAGAGLSCDAYHPTTPDPQGRGAQIVMQAALDDAQIQPKQVGYINLHGTGTPDNDAAEAYAIRSVFGPCVSAHSSSKGALGHTLAGAGALEAAVCINVLRHGWLPANTGCKRVDPKLGLEPLTKPTQKPIGCILSNSFGFGGNNASVVLCRPDFPCNYPLLQQTLPLYVQSCSYVTGAGDQDESWNCIRNGASCAGLVDVQKLEKHLSKRAVRRIKHLSKMVLALGQLLARPSNNKKIDQICFATGWGPLTETKDFLDRLFRSPAHLSSPTDFIGSVHNSPAGLLAIREQATGPNITCTSPETAFEQALLVVTGLLEQGKQAALIAADQYHHQLSPLLEPTAKPTPSEGGAALLLSLSAHQAQAQIRLAHFAQTKKTHQTIGFLIDTLGGIKSIHERFGLIIFGLSALHTDQGQKLLAAFRKALRPTLRFVDYKQLIGTFATSSAIACAVAVDLLNQKHDRGHNHQLYAKNLSNKGILILSLGSFLGAIEILPVGTNEPAQNH